MCSIHTHKLFSMVMGTLPVNNKLFTYWNWDNWILRKKNTNSAFSLIAHMKVRF